MRHQLPHGEQPHPAADHVRPRFSLRRLLIGFTLFSVVFYVLIVHPSVAANRFAAAINRGDFRQLESLGMLKDLKEYGDSLTFEDCKVRAELRGRTWRDLYKLRRKVWVIIAFPKELVRGPESSLANFVTIHINGPEWGEEP